MKPRCSPHARCDTLSFGNDAPTGLKLRSDLIAAPLSDKPGIPWQAGDGPEESVLIPPSEHGGAVPR